MEKKKHNIIDLFAGCGGLSTGFEMSGFSSILAVEKDPAASETYAFNHPDSRVITEDITQILDLDILGIKSVDGIIGGPPCQGFSLSGFRDPKDPRNSLFMEFVRFIKFYKPKFFVMENVPGILSMKNASGDSVIEIVIKEFSGSGYNVQYRVLDASDFGVPQKRQRVIIIGFRNDLNVDDRSFFPTPTTFFETEKITIREAINDLPQINAGEGEEVMDYSCEPQNDYQRLMREDSERIYNHVAMKHTQRLVERFKVIKEGQSLADVPPEHMQRQRGDASKISGKTYSQNNMRPYADKPSPTIPASFQGNFIHPWLDRNYTAREAARLQSFPDTYIFKGKRTTMSWEKTLSQYQQIGNAVPPLLAKAIAKNIKTILDKII